MSYKLRLMLSKVYRSVRPIIGNGNRIINQSKNHRLKFDVKGDHNIIEIQKSVLNNVTIYIRGNNNRISIDDNCIINNSVLWVENDKNQIEIARNTTVEGAHLGVAENEKKIILNENCMLSSGIYITTTDSHSILDENGQRINYGGNVVVEKNVWIGRNVTILKNVNIGEYAIVGANALVVKDLENNSLYVGVPAKKVRSNISWIREKI